MKKVLSLFVLLCTVFAGAWAETSRLIASTNETNPEYVYYVKGTSNGCYWSWNTTPTRTTANAAEFAFYAVSGVNNAYYIKCVSGSNAGKWVSYTKQSGYTGKRDFITFVDDKAIANYYYFNLTNGNELAKVYYDIRPYNTTDVSGFYLNWFQGVGNGGYTVDGTQTLGIWSQNGNDDAGSRWTLIAKPKFQYAATADAVSHWYKLKIRANRYVSFNDDENIYNSVTDAPAEYTSEYYFGFVGTPFEGFKIINMAAGRNRAMTSRVVASDCLTMAEDINNATQYIFETNSNLVFREKSTQNAYLNSIDNSKGLGYWVHGSSYNDGGSSFTIEEAEVGTTYDITFNYQLDGVAIGTRQVVVKEGTTPAYVLPAYVEAIDAPTIAAANANTSYTINTRYKNDATYPFEIGKYFYLKNNTSGRYMAVADESGKLTLSSTTVPTEANAEQYSFRFEGDWLNGFKIYHQGGTHFTTKDSYAKVNNLFEAQQEALHGDADKGIGDVWYIKYGTHNRGNATTGYYMINKKWRVSPVYYSSGHTYASHLAELNYTGNTFTFIKSPYNVVSVTANLVGVWSDDERVNLGSTNVEVVENRNFDVAALTLPDYYGEPKVVGTSNLTVTESNKTFDVELTPAFPFVAGNIYRIHSAYADNSKKGKFYADGDNPRFEKTQNNTTYTASANTDLWIFSHVAGTANQFTLKNFSNGKYLTIPNSNRTMCTLEESPVDNDAKTSYLIVTKSTNANAGANNFSLQTSKAGSNFCVGPHMDGGGTSDPFVNGIATWGTSASEGPGNASNCLEILATEYTANLAATDGVEHYGSIYLPYTMTLPEGVEAYAAAQDGEVLKLAKVGEAGNVIPEGAYILYSASATSANLALYADATVSADENQLDGRFEANVALPAGSNYVLNDKNSVVGFYKYSQTTYPVAKAVFCAGTESSVSAFRFDFEKEQTTSIESLIQNMKLQGEVLDLQGRRLNKAQKGMNIINGHKVLVK